MLVGKSLRYDDSGNRFCTACRQYLSESAFGKNKAIADGLHIYCKPCNTAKGLEVYRRDPATQNAKRVESLRRWRDAHPDQVVEQYGRRRVRVRKLREAAIQYYGGRCACCGESRFEFLAIDHVNNDGAAHRKTVHASRLIWWLRDNEYPEGFQVLCHNCNMAKAFYDVCPHQRK